MGKTRHTWVPIEREKDIVCNYGECSAGMGLAGNGQCYRKGNPYNKNCGRFEDEDKIMSDYEDWNDDGYS